MGELHARNALCSHHIWMHHFIRCFTFAGERDVQANVQLYPERG
jgi:hypothetical protein